MDRRAFIGAIGPVAYGLARGAAPQPATRMRHLGLLREGPGELPHELVHALRSLGWIDNQNIRFELRNARSREELADLAADLVAREVDLIVTGSTFASWAAKLATSRIPIVFGVGSDPVRMGLVATMARPGGNLTGFALGLYDAKQVQILKAAIPAIASVAYPDGPELVPGDLDAMKQLGVEVRGVALNAVDDFASFFAAASKAGADAVVIHDVAMFTARLPRIGIEASKSRMPAIGFRRSFAESGGLMSYSPLMSEMRTRQAIQIDRILRGAKPADLPVEQPTRFEFVINVREAAALGLSIPRRVRLSADELIQ